MWDFRKLDVWEKSFDLVEAIYNITNLFPTKERYGLCTQLQRATISISSNIAEGCGRRTNKDFVSFLHNALGSVNEVETQLLIAEKLGYVDRENINELIGRLHRIGKMLVGLIKNMQGRDIK
jgi:four helix bundle protein